MSDREGVSREQLFPVFPNTNHCSEHLTSKGKKFKASRGKVPENAQSPFITQGLSRSWSPKGQTGSKSRKTSLWKRIILKHSDVEECSAKNPETRLCWKLGDSSGKSHSRIILFLLGIPWWPLAGTGMREVDLAQEIPSSILITSWGEFGDCCSAGILSWVFHRSTSCSSGQWWIRSSDSKGKSSSLFCSKN